MSTYMGGKMEETVGERGKHEAISVNILVPKDPDVCMAQCSFGIYSNICSNYFRHRVRQVPRHKGLRKKGFKRKIDRSILSDTAMMLEVKSC